MNNFVKGNSLTTNQRRAVLLLAIGSPPSEVADEIGVAAGTVYNWKSQHGEFQSALQAVQSRIYEDGVRQLQSLVAEATASLRSVLVSPESSDRDKIGAARTVLQYANLNPSTESQLDVRSDGPDEFLKRMGLAA